MRTPESGKRGGDRMKMNWESPQKWKIPGVAMVTIGNYHMAF